MFGTSPRYLAELQARNIAPSMEKRRVFYFVADTYVENFGLDGVRVVTCTGSVLSADQYRWVYEIGFPASVHLISMSGGTDIAGCCECLHVGRPCIFPANSYAQSWAEAHCCQSIRARSRPNAWGWPSKFSTVLRSLLRASQRPA